MRGLMKGAVTILGSLLVIGAAAYGYFWYAPAPDLPALSSVAERLTIKVGHRERSYLAYVPANLPQGSPLVVVRILMEWTMRGIVKVAVGTLGCLLVLGAAVYGYFWHAPAPDLPPLSSVAEPLTVQVGDRKRSSLAYVPAHLAPGSPLVIVLHDFRVMPR